MSILGKHGSLTGVFLAVAGVGALVGGGIAALTVTTGALVYSVYEMSSMAGG